MKFAKAVLMTAAIAAFITASATSAFAQTNLNLISLDENGNGFVNGARLSYTISPDPFSQIATLQYFLPFAGATNRPGDLVLMETSGEISDILRFDGVGRVWFFSEREATDVPPFDLADVAVLPPVFTNNYVLIPEIGPEGQNGAHYFPLPGQPGWDQVYQFTYDIISDVVPEPGACLLAGLGALLLAMRLRHQARGQPRISSGHRRKVAAAAE